jgi:dienelactone hydrolase
MWHLIARPLDRIAIRSACGSVRPSPDGESHFAEAVEFLQRTDFFTPKVPAADVRFTGPHRFEFASPIVSGETCNDLVRGSCELAGANWQQRPSVIFLHGWNAEMQYEWLLPHWSRLLARAGVNAFRFELPFHCTRRPGSAALIRNFLSGDLLHVARMTHQALADVRALAVWLRQQGSPNVGLWGTSLGAWLTGLAAAHQREIDLAVLLSPVVRMDRALELAFCDPIRAEVSAFKSHFAALNLVAQPPPPVPANVLLVSCKLDLFAPTETIDELEAAWRPEVWRLRHGHISVLFSAPTMRRIVQWVATKMAALQTAETSAR